MNTNNNHQSLTMLLMDNNNNNTATPGADHTSNNSTINNSLILNHSSASSVLNNQSSMMVDSNLVMQMMRLMMNEPPSSSSNTGSGTNNNNSSSSNLLQHASPLQQGGFSMSSNHHHSSPTLCSQATPPPPLLDVSQFQQQLAQVMAVCSSSSQQQQQQPQTQQALSILMLANNSGNHNSVMNGPTSQPPSSHTTSPNPNTTTLSGGSTPMPCTEWSAPSHLQQACLMAAKNNDPNAAAALLQQLLMANGNLTPNHIRGTGAGGGVSVVGGGVGSNSDPTTVMISPNKQQARLNTTTPNHLQVPSQQQPSMVESPGSLSSMTEMEQTANSIHVFIKKGFPPRKKGNHLTSEQPWHRLANPQSIHTQSPNVGSQLSKLSETSTCKIGTDCYYYLLLVLPSKYYSLSDLEFQLEEETKDDNESLSKASKKKASPKKKNTQPHVEMKIRGKDLSATTKFMGNGHRNGLPQHASPSTDSANSNIIAIFEILANKKKNKAKGDIYYNALLKCKKEKLVTMYIDIHSSCETANHDLEESSDVLDLSNNHEAASSDSTSTSTIKKRKKNDDENEMEDDDDDENATSEVGQPQAESSRKRSKSSSIPLQNVMKEKAAHPPTLFDQLKQWIIVTVFHQSITVDLSKFPNFAFPKELSPNEQFLLYVDVPTQLSENHDICFKILDFHTQQELTFAGEQWIDTNVVNCCNFNIQASLMSLHVEYAISFRDINHDRPLVFIVALKDKKTEVERIIYNGTPFNIKRSVSQEIDCIDELGISAIQCPGFDASTIENSTIAEIFDEIPTVNGTSGTANSDSFFASFNMVSESENILEDEFESLFGQ
ncbi:hypothetical protein C9374_014674 [Naegleria lovaniensis]|uniref:Uncharacterized protein n=1 Tax=Naegleria lovaniensis TaxID=51637 RepID=A0AA88GAF3_NAELO|nr:uncharacterized protein C9374_014674 [Naegleria lovaniensis]KAG2370680.1 hypothetical protein C9374_014674 [Naegleria lovaniensis]